MKSLLLILALSLPTVSRAESVGVWIRAMTCAAKDKGGLSIELSKRYGKEDGTLLFVTKDPQDLSEAKVGFPVQRMKAAENELIFSTEDEPDAGDEIRTLKIVLPKNGHEGFGGPGTKYPGMFHIGRLSRELICTESGFPKLD